MREFSDTVYRLACSGQIKNMDYKSTRNKTMTQASKTAAKKRVSKNLHSFDNRHQIMKNYIKEYQELFKTKFLYQNPYFWDV